MYCATANVRVLRGGQPDNKFPCFRFLRLVSCVGFSLWRHSWGSGSERNGGGQFGGLENWGVAFMLWFVLKVFVCFAFTTEIKILY